MRHENHQNRYILESIFNPQLCAKCYRTLRNSIVHGMLADRGEESQSLICFIGDVSTPLDIKYNMPFSGKTNILLREVIDCYKLTSFSYLTYLIKCNGSDNDERYVKHCLPHLITEIKRLNPSIIVPVGSFVLKTLTEKNHIIMKNEVNKPRVFANSIMIPIYSPTYIAKNNCYDEYDISFSLISDLFAKINHYYNIYR